MDTPLLVGMLLKVLARKRLLLMIHGEWHIPNFRQTILGHVRLYWMRRLVDHFVAISLENRRVMLESGVPSDRISSIPNGLDLGFFRPPSPQERRAVRAEHGYEVDDVVVLYLGRLIPRKRVDLLLHALAAQKGANNVKGLIVGDGPAMEHLGTLVTELGLDARMRFAGSVSNVRDYYWMSDIFLLPSMFEGNSVALLESMACGMPVLVTRSAGNLAVVVDGVKGLACEIDDLESLLQGLGKPVNDVAYRCGLGAEARQTSLATYSMQAVSEMHLCVYREESLCAAS